jgi:hypothetical protein
MNTTYREDPLAELERDLKEGESQKLEFKERFPEQARDLAEVIASFGTSNAGTVYLGVDDHAEVVGVEGISGLQDTQGKDAYNKRIQGTTQSIDPPIRVSVSFVDRKGKIVARIDVPKGPEPVYYVGGIPYLRDITSSRAAKALEVKHLHLLYFQTTRGVSVDSQQDFLTRLVNQLSDIRLLLSDYEDHLIKPDVYQMKYDLGASGRILLSLSSEPPAKQLGIEEQLVKTSDCLGELESHRFYLGRQSVDEFGEKARSCLELVMVLFNQVRKHTRPGAITDYKELVMSNIDSLLKEWNRRNTYFERGGIELLREGFRRFGYVFYRFGNYPEADTFANAGQNLRTLGEKLRNLSSTQKYFIYGIGTNPLREIEPKFEECIDLLQKVSKEMGNPRLLRENG